MSALHLVFYFASGIHFNFTHLSLRGIIKLCQSLGILGCYALNPIELPLESSNEINKQINDLIPTPVLERDLLDICFEFHLKVVGLSSPCALPPPVASLVLLFRFLSTTLRAVTVVCRRATVRGMLRRLLYQPSYTSGCLCIIPALIVSSINSGMMDGGLEGSDTIS